MFNRQTIDTFFNHVNARNLDQTVRQFTGRTTE